MSFRLMTEVLDCENLGPTEKLVMVCLARHVNEQTGKCFPSVERLMQCSGLGERAVQTNIKELTKRGFIVIVKGGGRGRANEYVLSVKGASKTPFEKPCISNTVLESVNPASNALNPAADAPQQRMNIEEQRKEDIIGENRKPSSSDVVAILCEMVDQEYAESFITHRKRLKKPFSEIAARRVVKTLREISDLGFDPNDALALTEERGWATIKTDWFMKEQNNDRNQSGNRNTSRGTNANGNRQPGGILGAALSIIADENDRDQRRRDSQGWNDNARDVSPKDTDPSFDIF